MAYTIEKSFEFCYGHRVWKQNLDDTKFTVSNVCKCRHLHGHQGKITVELGSISLSDGMVIDFNYLNWLKVFLDEVIDHKFLIDKNDPLFKTILGYEFDDVLEVPVKVHNSTVASRIFKPYCSSEELQEYFDGFIVLDFSPTSENLAEWIHNIIKKSMGHMVDVVSVVWSETPKSSAKVTS